MGYDTMDPQPLEVNSNYNYASLYNALSVLIILQNDLDLFRGIVSYLVTEYYSNCRACESPVAMNL